MNGYVDGCMVKKRFPKSNAFRASTFPLSQNLKFTRCSEQLTVH